MNNSVLFYIYRQTFTALKVKAKKDLIRAMTQHFTFEFIPNGFSEGVVCLLSEDISWKPVKVLLMYSIYNFECRQF